jgi:hypothetical protein
MSAWRCPILLTTALTGLTLAGLSTSPLAASRQAGCGKPELRAEGRRSDPGSSEYKEQVARRLSVNKWEQLALELHGRRFANWHLAKERSIECEHYVEAGFNGRVSCVAIGLPCDTR